MKFKVGDWVQGANSLRIGVVLSISDDIGEIDWKIEGAGPSGYALNKEDCVYLRRCYLVCKDCKLRNCPSLRSE